MNRMKAQDDDLLLEFNQLPKQEKETFFQTVTDFLGDEAI